MSTVTKNEGHRSWQVIRAIERQPGASLRLLPRERRVIRERNKGRTLAAIGVELDISAERVRQIEHQACRKQAAAQSRR